MILKIDDNTYIKFNPVTQISTTLNLQNMLEKKRDLEATISELTDYSDEKLLAWAKQNYPDAQGRKELEISQKELEHINDDLREIYGT